MLYELAAKKLYEYEDEAEKDCKKMNKERMKRYHEKKKTQQMLPLVYSEKADGMYE